MIETKTSIFIKSLAKEHNVEYTETVLDKFANKITELSGDNVRQDNTKDLIIALYRKQIISKSDVAHYTCQHLNELKKIISKS